MNPTRLCASFYFAHFSALIFCPVGALAADETVDGHLTVTGDADVFGRAEVGTFRINTNSDPAAHQRHGWRRFSWGGGGTSNWGEWKKVARLYPNGTLNSAIAFEGRIFDHRSSYGAQRGVSIPFSGTVRGFVGTGDPDNNTARIAQGQAESGNQYVRIVRVTANDFELQVRQAAAWRWMEVEWRITGDAGGNQVIEYFDTGSLDAGSPATVGNDINPTYDHFGSTGMLLAGKIGIGTTSLSQTVALEVAGDIKVSGNILNSSGAAITFASGLKITDDNSTGGIFLGSGASSDGANLRLLAGANQGQWNLDNHTGSLRFFTESSPSQSQSVKMLVNAGGNVGIGTLDPKAKLHIHNSNLGATPNFFYDDVYASQIIAAADAKLQLVSINAGTAGSGIVLSNAPSSGANTHWSINHVGSAVGDGLLFRHSSTTANGDVHLAPGHLNSLYLSETGNIGLGTTSPLAALHVKNGNSLLLGDRSLTKEISQGGDTNLTIPLGRYMAGVALTIDVRVEGNSAQMGGLYRLEGGYDALPKITFRSAHWLLATQLNFHAYVDPASSGHIYIFATWQRHASTPAGQLNTLYLNVSSVSLFDTNPNPAGSFALATPLSTVLATSNAGGVQITGDVTIKNVGATKSVIRISPAGDIPMIANPVGTNPN